MCRSTLLPRPRLRGTLTIKRTRQATDRRSMTINWCRCLIIWRESSLVRSIRRQAKEHRSPVGLRSFRLSRLFNPCTTPCLLSKLYPGRFHRCKCSRRCRCRCSHRCRFSHRTNLLINSSLPIHRPHNPSMIQQWPKLPLFSRIKMRRTRSYGMFSRILGRMRLLLSNWTIRSWELISNCLP